MHMRQRVMERQRVQSSWVNNQIRNVLDKSAKEIVNLIHVQIILL